jgi:hypothetical protein
MATRRLVMATVGLICVAGGGFARGQGPTPFADTYRRPAVSPYTMLGPGGAGGVAPGGGAGAGFNPLVYQQLIQPRVQQEQGIVSQIRQGRQIDGLSNRVQQIQQGTLSRQVSGQIRPTGHAATYLNLSHYYGR